MLHPLFHIYRIQFLDIAQYPNQETILTLLGLLISVLVVVAMYRHIDNLPRNAGFTLMELLVVIAIIGVIGVMLTVTLGYSRASAREVRRVAELATVLTALELYHNDHNGYPPSGDWWINECSLSEGEFIIPDLVEGGYLSAPGLSDPLGCTGSHPAAYYYASNIVDYKLIAHNEELEGKYPDRLDPAYHDMEGHNCNYTWGEYFRHYTIYSQGAACWQDADNPPWDYL